MGKLVLLIGGIIAVLVVLSHILQEKWDNSPNGIVGKAYNPPNILPSIEEVQERILRSGGAVTVDGKFSPQMEEEWNKVAKANDINA